MAAWSWATVEEGLGVAIKAVLPAGMGLRWAEQDLVAGAGARPYAELGWLDAVPASPHAEQRLLPGGPAGTYIALDQLTRVCTIDVHTTATRGADAATAVLEAVRASLALDAPLAAIAALGLRVLDRGQVRNLAALVDVRYEGRAQMELRLAYAVGQTQDLSWVESASATGTYS